MEQEMALGNNVNLSTNLALTPQMLQSVTVLQYNALELEQAITTAIETNPLLEECNDDDTITDPDELSDDDTDGDSLHEDKSIDIDQQDDFYGNTISEDWCGQSNTDPGAISPTIATSIADALRAEMKHWDPSASIRKIIATAGASRDRLLELVNYVIDSLDDNGLLTTIDGVARCVNPDADMESIERFIDGYSFDTLTPMAQAAILSVREFGPVGVATRTMQECLIEQAYANVLPDECLTILTGHYKLFEGLQYSKLAEVMHTSIKNIRGYIDRISELRLYPCRSMDATPEEIYPVVKIIQSGKKIVPVAIQSTRKFGINRMYADMATDHSLSSADRKYIKGNLLQAKAFMRSVGDRYRTLERVTAAIIARQKNYFTNNGDLVPMSLSDIASDTGLSVSTISRATSNKYADTIYGMVNLGALFTTEMKQGDTAVSTTTIVSRIKDMIDHEDTHNPLSDQAITDRLASEGFSVSRRAVAKYREETLHILSTRHRKR